MNSEQCMVFVVWIVRRMRLHRKYRVSAFKSLRRKEWIENFYFYLLSSVVQTSKTNDFRSFSPLPFTSCGTSFPIIVGHFSFGFVCHQNCKIVHFRFFFPLFSSEFLHSSLLTFKKCCLLCGKWWESGGKENHLIELSLPFPMLIAK